jgi:hypothetical protein
MGGCGRVCGVGIGLGYQLLGPSRGVEHVPEDLLGVLTVVARLYHGEEELRRIALKSWTGVRPSQSTKLNLDLHGQVDVLVGERLDFVEHQRDYDVQPVRLVHGQCVLKSIPHNSF